MEEERSGREDERDKVPSKIVKNEYERGLTKKEIKKVKPSRL